MKKQGVLNSKFIRLLQYNDLCLYMLSFINRKVYKLLDWLTIDNLDFDSLNNNENAVDLLLEYPDKIDYNKLCYNPNAIHLIKDWIAKKEFDKINWNNLCLNPTDEAIDILEMDASIVNSKYTMKIYETNLINFYGWKNLASNKNVRACNLVIKYSKIIPKSCKYVNNNNITIWYYLSRNPVAIDIIEEELVCQRKKGCKINYSQLCRNPKIIKIIESIPESKIDWMELSKNKEAIPILEKNLDKLDPQYFSYNEKAVPILDAIIKGTDLQLNKYKHLIDWIWLSMNKGAKDIIMNNLDKIDWNGVALNSSAIEIIKNNRDKLTIIDKAHLSENPEIFEIDNDIMMKNKLKYYEELKKSIII
jgi:hypothetical protein